MSRNAGRLGGLVRPFVEKLIADLGPMLESFLIALLAKAVGASSATKTGIAVTDGVQSETGSPITPRELAFLAGLLKGANWSDFSDHAAEFLNQQLMQHGAVSFSSGCANGGDDTHKPLSA